MHILCSASQRSHECRGRRHRCSGWHDRRVCVEHVERCAVADRFERNERSGPGNDHRHREHRAGTLRHRNDCRPDGHDYTARRPSSGSIVQLRTVARSYAAGAGGGSVAVALDAGSGCSWTTRSNASWITVASGESGSGPATVVLSVASNAGGGRAGTVTIGGQVFSVSQEAPPAPPPPPPPCSYAITPGSESVAPQGGSVSVSVATGNGCAWTAAANAGWITIASGGSGSGTGAVSLSIAANTGAARTATATIAGNTFTVGQAAVPCQYTISPTQVTFSPSAGSGTVTVTTGSGCTWTATSQDSWISITAGSSGTGSGTVKYGVSANDQKERAGDMTIAGQTFPVAQTGTKD